VVEPNRDQLIQIGTLIDTGRIQPIIETVFPLSQARKAYEQGARGHTRGKIVLHVGSNGPFKEELRMGVKTEAELSPP